jgi:Restriction endonuclease XhoI.
LIVSPKKNLVAAIELKSQVGSYGNNLNNRAEESLGSSVDFWKAYRTKSFPARYCPWLGYVMIVGREEKSEREIRVYEPLFKVRPEFEKASYLDRYQILAQRLVLERKYSAVGLIATSDLHSYKNLSDDTSLESFIRRFKGHLIGVSDEFE